MKRSKTVVAIAMIGLVALAPGCGGDAYYAEGDFAMARKRDGFHYLGLFMTGGGFLVAAMSTGAGAGFGGVSEDPYAQTRTQVTCGLVAVLGLGMMASAWRSPERWDYNLEPQSSREVLLGPTSVAVRWRF
jgi:hypothetical protein